MSKLTFEKLLEAGVHFGHLKRKWNPAMAPYIFEEKKGIHIIDLNKTLVSLSQASAAMKQIARSGKKVLFVATKKQAKEIVEQKVGQVNMPYVTERWSGGMLTNLTTTRKSIKKMSLIDKMQSDGTWDTLNKREKLFKTRQREKLEKTFGSIADMTRTPAAIFIVDIVKEHIALAEAKRLNIPTFAIVDTNSNPKLVDFPIPANDDATKSIALILDEICGAIQQGLDERKNGKDDEQEFTEEAEGVGLVPMEQVERPKRQRKAKTEGNEGTAEAAATVESAAAIEVVPVIAETPESEEIAPAEEIAVVSEVTETPVSEEVAPVEETVVESEVVETTATEETTEETTPEVKIKEETTSEAPSEEVEAPASEEAPTPNEE
jgi:small subunit ribosomal protein S2